MLHGGKANRKKQKHLSVRKGAALLLAAVMLFSVMPSSVFAVESIGSEQVGIENISTTVPLIQTPSVTTLTSGAVTVSGVLPEGAYLEVEALSEETAQSLLEQSETDVLFAYDIKIMLPGSPSPTEYQPDADNPVTVTITPDTPIESPVEVVHIAEDKATGEAVPETVAVVTPSETGAVEFQADAFSVYVGTVTVGSTLLLSPGSGYAFYSDAGCTTQISGSQQVSAGMSIYAKANTNYIIESITIKNADSSNSTAAVTGTSGTAAFEINFADEPTQNQIITVTAFVNAPGGTITSSSTDVEVAAMFDATATTAETENVSVTVDAGTFTLQIKGNTLVKNTITVESGANVILTPLGDPIVKRDPVTCTGAMIVVNGTLSLGTGTDPGSTVTYHFNDGSSETRPPNDAIPTSEDASIASVTVNRNYSSTTAGTLVIDGGAIFTVPVNAETKTVPTCITQSTGSIVETSGTLILWDGVTIQNNYNNTSNDNLTYPGVRILNGNFYMYGGMITQCSTRREASKSDGGGVTFLNGNAYFYGGVITQCCADNGAAVAIFGVTPNKPTAYYLGTDIYLNLASDATDFPGQACSAYNGAGIRMYAGSITNNKNLYTDGHDNADFDMKPSGTNSGVDLFGGAIGKLGVVFGATVNVYDCEIDKVQGDGTVVYNKGFAVTLPDCVALTTTDEVTITIKKKHDTIYENYITITKKGDGGSPDLNVDLLPGDYKITVDSPSMRKEYTAVVNTVPMMATSISRTMTAPIILSRTSNSVKLIKAGTDNVADGEILYGYSSTDNANNVPQNGDGAWQSSPDFTSGLTGIKYFFIKASVPSPNPNNFNESISPGLTVDFSVVPSVSILSSTDPMAFAVGTNHNISIETTPTAYDTASILWSVSGNASAGTSISTRPDGRGSLTIAVDESALTFTVTVELLDKDLGRIGTGVTDSMTVQTSPLAYIVYTDLEAPTELTAQLALGSVDPYTYSWERFDGDLGAYTAISGETSSTYSATYSDIGKNIRVIITDGSNVYTSASVIINAPVINVTVPLTAAVTINAAGECTVSSGSIENNTDIPVYVTNVLFAWVTDGTADANELFTACAAVTARLTLNSTQYNFTGAVPAPQAPSAANGLIAAKVGDTPGSLATPWTFILNTSKIKLVPAMGTSLTVATVTYTVDYSPAS